MKISYDRKRISLLTKHGKESIIAPILKQTLGCDIELVQSFNTDELGTFDRTVKHQGTQLQTARRKAQIGIDFSGNTLGVASEGSFVPDPFSGFMPWNIEMVIFLDDLRGLEVVGMAKGSAMSMGKFVRNIDELLQFAQDAGFPRHQLMLRPEHENDPRVVKELHDLDHLISVYIEAQQQSSNGKVFVENDLRAFANPTRQHLIAQATEDLARKILSLCPQCGMPGYWKVTTEAGMLLNTWGPPKHLPACETWHCKHCEYETCQSVSPAESTSHSRSAIYNP
jgi:hypothetical protein